MLTPASGRITLDGRDLSRLPRRELAREIAVVPQETRLSFEYSVLEVVLMGRYPHLGAFELEGRDDLRIAREAMAATGTLALEDRSFPTLSGGEKQRVIIAGALAQSAQLMLLDEPTAALDPGYQIEIAALLRPPQRRARRDDGGRHPRPEPRSRRSASAWCCFATAACSRRVRPRRCSRANRCGRSTTSRPTSTSTRAPAT